MTREDAYGALFTLLQTVPVKTRGRRLELLEEMDAPQLPALFMTVGNQNIRDVEGAGPIRTLTAHVFVYARNSDRHTPAGIQLNGLLDAIEAALAPTWGAQTLGGEVQHAWIEGEIEVFELPQGEKAAAIVPIKILMP